MAPKSKPPLPHSKAGIRDLPSGPVVKFCLAMQATLLWFLVWDWDPAWRGATSPSAAAGWCSMKVPCAAAKTHCSQIAIDEWRFLTIHTAGISKLQPIGPICRLLSLVNHVYWNTAILIYLSIAGGCFCVTTAKMSNCDRDCMAHKA